MTIQQIRNQVKTALTKSIQSRAQRKGLVVKKAKVLCVTYNADWTLR
jgi:hypothetical protein